jgi:hypothetical protein
MSSEIGYLLAKKMSASNEQKHGDIIRVQPHIIKPTEHLVT